MPSALRPALPAMPTHRGAQRARRDALLRGFASVLAALTATIAVLGVAAAAVAFAIG
jgi:hypothetical protein